MIRRGKNEEGRRAARHSLPRREGGGRVGAGRGGGCDGEQRGWAGGMGRDGELRAGRDVCLCSSLKGVKARTATWEKGKGQEGCCRRPPSVTQV